MPPPARASAGELGVNQARSSRIRGGRGSRRGPRSSRTAWHCRRVAVGVLGTQEERAEAAELEVRFVAPGRHLMERVLGALGRLAGRADEELRLEAVVEAFVGREGIDRGAYVRAGHGRFHLELVAAFHAHVLAHELAPKFRVAGPAQPLDAPVVLHVARERERPAEPRPPARENGLAPIRFAKRAARCRLELRRDVAVKELRRADRDALQEIRRARLARRGNHSSTPRLLRNHLGFAW